jgi:DNA-binding CsgD family transcriptional regulator/PAS domain-containing protein
MTRITPADVTGLIYEAIADAKLWPVALTTAGKLLDVDGLLLLYWNARVGRPQVIASIGFNGDALARVAARHLDDDELVRASLQLPAGQIVSRTFSFRDAETCTTIFRRSLSHVADRIQVVGAAAIRTAEFHASLWMARDETRPPFASRDLAAFGGLLPHIGRAMTVHHRVARAERDATMAAGAIDRIAVGMVLIDAGGRAILVNREAERIFAQADGLSIRVGLMYAADSNQTSMLRRVIRRVGCGADEQGGSNGGAAIRIARHKDRPPYHVVVIPLPRRCQPGDSASAVAVAFITDSERGQSTVELLCGDLYGLTAAETRLVSTLVESPGLTAAAKTLGLSRNTVHSQLASVFQKTGTRSQSELLRLILGGIASIKGPDVTSGFHQALADPVRPDD